jgi:phosphoglycolate phosphatase-like HAD superfamily hydrolase
VTLAVFDIDGVVADVRHRLHHLDRHPRDWASFFGEADADVPLKTGTDLVHAAMESGHEVAWLTGRPAWLRSVTRQWLKDLHLPTAELLMRPHSDFRPARTFKVEALKRLAARDIVLFVDDDPDVIDSATAAGFPAHLATWVPHSKTLARAQEVDGRT